MYLLIKHIDPDIKGEHKEQTDLAWQHEPVWHYDNEQDALDAADRYNTNLALAGVPSWICSYSVSHF
jgi:hypothetical protein